MRYLRAFIVTVLTLGWLAPTYLLVVNAIGPSGVVTTNHIWDLPHKFALFSNITTAWTAAGFGTKNLVNAIVYSLVAPAVAVLVSALAGYAIVVLRVRFGAAWFVLLFGATVLPLQMLAAPLFIGYGRTHLYDTRIGMVLIYVAVSIPFAVFVMRNFFGEVSRSVYEASQVDGASAITTFFRIYVPMSSSALIAVFVLQFTFVWNDLFLGLSLATNTGAQGITPALSGLTGFYGGASYPVILAGALVVAMPTIVVFLFAQRFFTKGLSLGQY